MSQETNNEVDLLLRRMGRRDSSDARNAAASVQDQHLDADELSSYAQNALPAAARARYTAHLAECATCRRLVTELSLSLGAAAAPLESAPEPSGWKTFLASLFSPMVLRYAVPALGVIVVMIVGFVVLRQRNQHELMARLQDKSSTAAAPSPQTTPADGFIASQPQVADKIENGNVKPAEPQRNTNNIAAETGAAGSGVAAPAPPPAAKDQPAVAEVKPPVTATPVATAAPAKAAESPQESPADADAIAKQREVESRDKKLDEPEKEPAPQATRGLATIDSAKRTAQNAPPKTERSNNNRVFGVASSVAGARPGSADRAAEEKRDDAKRAEAQEASNETRTIAGRHFRKQGGIWTDTAYDSSTATVNMTRNSEQFRALVADEAAIGTIARQLDGEVIVVWKGRAYHIR